MNGPTTDRLQRLLMNIDGFGERLASLQHRESQKVRAAVNHGSAFNACQLALGASACFDGVKVLLFKDVIDAKVNHPRNVGWFSERIDGLAPSQGLSCAHIALSIIGAAEHQLAAAEQMLLLAEEASRVVS